MPTKRDTVGARLRRSREQWNSYEFRQHRKETLNRDGDARKADEDAWGELARQALGFEIASETHVEGPGQHEGEQILLQAFWTFNLDPADPRDWRALLDIFTSALAPDLVTLSRDNTAVGAPKKWTAIRLYSAPIRGSARLALASRSR